MSAGTCQSPCCDSPSTTQVPGNIGQSAFTTTAAPFTVPALAGLVTITVANSDWAAIGESIFIPGAGTFTITGIPDSTHLSLSYDDIPANTSAGFSMSNGLIVTPTGQSSDGTDGGNAYTLTTANFVVPAVGATVIINVASSAWAVVGQNVFVEGAGVFEVTAKPSALSLTLEYLIAGGNTHATETIVAGAGVSPSGGGLAVALPTVITDNSTGTASNTIAAGVGISTVTIPLTSLATGLSTAALDLLTTYTPGYAFKLLAFDFVTTIVGAGAVASQVFNLEIGAVNVTGGALTVTLASTDTIGEVTSGTAITALNVGTASDTISIEMAAGGTVFTAGSGYFLLRVQNLDSANAVASLADHINDILASLG